MSKREFQDDDRVRVYGMPELTHVNGGGMQSRRSYRMAKIIRRDEQHGRGQWRILYDDMRQDVVAEARLEHDPDAEDDAA